MFYHIKKKIILNNLKKKKEQNPFNLEESELYVLPSDADDSINNSYFFTAHDNNGDCLVVRLGLRNNRDSEVFFYYKKNGLFLTHPKDAYPAEECPVKVKCLKPGETWTLDFDGDLKEYEGDKLHHCVLHAVFEAKYPAFDFFYHSNSKGMAEAMAREKWTKTYFDEVRMNDQRHYEQTGDIKGTMKVDDTEQEFSLHCVRDHSFGKRNWDYMDDHIWVCGITEKGEVINFSFVNYPCMKKIYLGYTDIDKKENTTLCGYELLDYSIQDGKGPEKSVLKLFFEDKTSHVVTCRRDANIPIVFGDGKYVFQEGIGEFSVDGIKARGTIEYGFNTDKKRWNY